MVSLNTLGAMLGKPCKMPMSAAALAVVTAAFVTLTAHAGPAPAGEISRAQRVQWWRVGERDVCFIRNRTMEPKSLDCEFRATS